jgi:hypothetical protein
MRGVLAAGVVGALAVGFAGSVQARPPTRNGLRRTPDTASLTRTCADSNYSEGSEPADWLSPSNGAVTGGPVGWPLLRAYLSQLPPSSYQTRHGLARGVKGLVAILAGHEARVVIPAAERTRLALDYASSPPLPPRAILGGFAYFRVRDGESQVTLHACSPHSGSRFSTFPGYFLVAGKQCARIDIYTGASTVPIRRQIPFGVPGRSCPSAP